MEEKKNLTLEELEQEKKSLEQENEYLKMRKMDVALYQKAYEKYAVKENKSHLTYDRLLDHPDYYTKWRNTFFDSQIKLIESGIFVRSPEETTEKSLAERKYIVERGRELKKRDYSIPFTPNEKQEYEESKKYTNACVLSPESYERNMDGLCKFSELKYDFNNPNKKPTYMDVDMPWCILGYCDSIKTTDGKFQLHLVDPRGECLFAPFDISPEEAELALGRICVVNCAYNHYATEPKLLELQILPFTLNEKLGEYTTDTVVIRRYPKINYQPWAFLG